MLTTADAKAIAAVVAADPEASKRIDSNIDGIIPASWGISGGIRNAGYVALGMVSLGYYGDPSEKEFADRVCTGISDAAAAAINSAVAAKDARLRNVLSASAISRVHRSVDHTATRIQMVDKQEHVFDWHATLDADNPMMYRSVSDWMKDANGIALESFNGWK